MSWSVKSTLGLRYRRRFELGLLHVRLAVRGRCGREHGRDESSVHVVDVARDQPLSGCQRCRDQFVNIDRDCGAGVGYSLVREAVLVGVDASGERAPEVRVGEEAAAANCGGALSDELTCKGKARLWLGIRLPTVALPVKILRPNAKRQLTYGFCSAGVLLTQGSGSSSSSWFLRGK